MDEVYLILTIDDPQIVDFTFYTDEEVVSRRVSELNKLAKHSVYWYITLYQNSRDSGNDGEIGEV